MYTSLKFYKLELCCKFGIKKKTTNNSRITYTIKNNCPFFLNLIAKKNYLLLNNLNLQHNHDIIEIPNENKDKNIQKKLKFLKFNH